MRRAINSIFFDKRDYKLIEIVNSVSNDPKILGYTGKLLYPFFHPLGIKELAESRGLRAAYSILNLMESIKTGDITSRLKALAGLKDDIVNTVGGPIPQNTSRVLLQIMKDLVRAKADPEHQLKLAHDFRIAAFGKPRVIRNLLDHYHLLEMPEEWNQITFDDHVHDANTSGRKSATHLIMDAWIKGIRRLRVIYYHYIEPKCALELIEAARIMEIDLRIGIEFWPLYRDRYISLIWVSRGLPDLESFLSFLAEPSVIQFMEQGKALVKFQEAYLCLLLDRFNQSGRKALCRKLDITMACVTAEEFFDFVGPGQPSLHYLGEFIHSKVLKAIHVEISRLKEGAAGPEVQTNLDHLSKIINEFMVSDILEQYLDAEDFFSGLYDYVKEKKECAPPRLCVQFCTLLDQIGDLLGDFRITLNLDRLRPEDVLELLYESGGRISRIEIINLTKYDPLNNEIMLRVYELQAAVNQGSLLKLKRIISKIILEVQEDVQKKEGDQKQSRLNKLSVILNDIDEFKHMFDARPIKLRIGSDSTGKLGHYGMGFAVLDTLPFRVRQKIKKEHSDWLHLPVNVKTRLCTMITPPESVSSTIAWIPGIRGLLSNRKRKWIPEFFLLHPDSKGNLVTLGRSALMGQKDNFAAESGEKTKSKKSVKYLKSPLKNFFKVIVGFIPAQLCFMLTKDWWVLSYFGALIWFGITGIRNVIQSVLGGGGIKRASRLKWNDYVSWDRLTDSLLFTGFSVPLLDYLVKTLLLDKTLGITINTDPVTLYAVMGLANGIYLSTHNFFRGLPKGAVTGNFFRSIISIPVAVLLNSGIGAVLVFFNVPNINSVLQKWAAIISKSASDIVAGVIEAGADRSVYTHLRKQNIRKKIVELFDIYSKLIMLFPETEELTILENSGMLLDSKNSEVRDLATLIIINALDLFYFWMYLPRAQSSLIRMVLEMTPEEKVIFFQAQNMLRHEHHISRLFVDGILGGNFSRPLSFYLTSYRSYLESIEKVRASIPEEKFDEKSCLEPV
ncbi:MAG: hypothetical protein CSA25_00410 [Desulfobacter postgatei]|uniref:Uncharacterized protein n=1 Tax=Desulfobacter postgatei TaxID=2293 RepID=A0A2G6MTM4_9BACT|nr:MAG: hypothetical protein CSA25_00410 [Desulfobacter postgatei]